jgi:arginyl-tRNA--protein-N-Asp/Glu arginylyltransferase
MYRPLPDRCLNALLAKLWLNDLDAGFRRLAKTVRRPRCRDMQRGRSVLLTDQILRQPPGDR